MIRPSRSTAAAVLFTAALMALAPASASAKKTVAQKKQIARSQFDDAERLREALNGKPEKQRTKNDYKRVIDAYRRVYYVAPTSNRADESAMAVGDLLLEFGRRFDDRKSLQDAIQQYQFLRREYPGSRHRIEALFTIGQVYREDLEDAEQAKTTFADVAKKYPGTDLGKQAQDALADIAKEEKDAKEPKSAAKKSSSHPVAGATRVRQPQEIQDSTARNKKDSAPEREEIPIEVAAEETPKVTPVKAEVKRTRLPLVTSIR